MKIIPPLRNSESKAPQKILMIRFETKTWLMENQVKLSCFSPVSVHLEIWLQLFWRLLDQNKSRFDTEAAAEAERLYNYTKRAFTGLNTALTHVCVMFRCIQSFRSQTWWRPISPSVSGTGVRRAGSSAAVTCTSWCRTAAWVRESLHTQENIFPNIWMINILNDITVYVTLEHKTSHKGQFLKKWNLCIIWKPNK